MKSSSVCIVDTAINHQNSGADSPLRTTLPYKKSGVLETDDTENATGPCSNDLSSQAIDAKVESGDEAATAMEQTDMDSPRYPRWGRELPARLTINASSPSQSDDEPSARGRWKERMQQNGVQRCGLRYMLHSSWTVGRRSIAPKTPEYCTPSLFCDVRETKTMT